MAIREGRWDCSTCGTRGILGRQIDCPQCATPRPQGVRFYLPEDASEVSDAALLADAAAGADWICEHCGGSSRANVDACADCGAPRGSSPSQDTHDYSLTDVPRGADEAAPLLDRRAGPPPPPTSRRGSWIRRGLGAITVALAGWCYLPQQVTAVVAEKSWERSLEVEAYRTVRESDWSVPTGGRQSRSYQAIRSYRQELERYETRTRTVSEQVQVGTRTYTCGQRDLGNGYFEDRTCTEPEYETRTRQESYQEPIYRQVPIYDTKFDYDIERWVTDTVLVQRGAVDEPSDPDRPAWPEPRLGERLRAGERTEKYTLTFRDEDGKTYSHEVPLAQYEALRQGAAARIKVNRMGRVLEIGEPGS